MTGESAGLPRAVDRATFQAEVDALRVREKAHTHEGDAIAAARRRLPMVEVDAGLTLSGPNGPITLLEAFEGRQQLIAYYFMWHTGHPAAEQCEGCTWVTAHVSELSYLHSRDITYAVLCQGRNQSVGFADAQTSYEESRRSTSWGSAVSHLRARLATRHGIDSGRRGGVQRPTHRPVLIRRAENRQSGLSPG